MVEKQQTAEKNEENYFDEMHKLTKQDDNDLTRLQQNISFFFLKE